jgi:hypothetical protein
MVIMTILTTESWPPKNKVIAIIPNTNMYIAAALAGLECSSS